MKTFIKHVKAVSNIAPTMTAPALKQITNGSMINSIDENQSLPPAYVIRREVMFHRCVSVKLFGEVRGE